LFKLTRWKRPWRPALAALLLGQCCDYLPS